MKHIEEIFERKCQGNENEVLWSQWIYDKKTVPVALQSISHIFPHYSLHDESHSITILNNITRIVGVKQLDNLSAIDLWLLLEAAYKHDIGMVVPHDSKDADIQTTEFLVFFENILNDPNNKFFNEAKNFIIRNNKI